MTRSRTWCLVEAVLLIAAVQTGWTQQPADDPIAALAAKDALADEDREALRAWIAERVTAVAAGDAAGGQQAFEQLRKGMRGTRNYQDAFAVSAVEAIGPAYKRANLVAAARLITLLGDIGEPRAVDLLLEALRDDRPAVRAAAAVALRKLEPRIASDAEALRRMVTALREAGIGETATNTLELIYRALALPEAVAAPDRREAAHALIAILEERLNGLAAGRPRAEGADHVALQTLRPLATGLEEEARRRYMLVLGRLLHHGVDRYVNGDPQLFKVREKTSSPELVEMRNSMELLITEAERQLVELLGLSAAEAPKVRLAMEKARYVDMSIEMNAWKERLKTRLGLELETVEQPEQAEPEAEPEPEPEKP